MFKQIIKIGKILVLSSVFIFLTGCGGSESTSSTNENTNSVTAVDGYIKDAVVQDSSGQTATYSLNGKYIFENKPVYPVSLNGGIIEDTNVSLNITLTLKNENSTVISPVSTFIDGNLSIYSKLNDLNISDNLYSDYIDKNDTSLAKLSQLLYIILQNDSLKYNFKNSLETNLSINTFDDLFALAADEIEKSNINESSKTNLLSMLETVKEINASTTSAEDIENMLKSYKIITTVTYKDPSFIGTIATGQVTNFYGNDDGALQKGTTKNYTRDDDKEVVIDNVTELMWQDDAEAKTTVTTWDTAVQYCEDLTLGGYEDWRLPSIEELASISYEESYNPSMDSVFQNVSSNTYWSSSVYVSDTYKAWIFNFSYSYSGATDKITRYYVRCVRNND